VSWKDIFRLLESSRYLSALQLFPYFWAPVVAVDAERISATDTNALAQRVGFVSLSWQAPTQRVDGESLSMSEIAGYRIYYGTGSGDYNSVLSVDQPYTFTILIDDLPVGTYYFAMTTVDTNGIESGFSREIARIVQS
jgi:hypothetical protein